MNNEEKINVNIKNKETYLYILENIKKIYNFGNDDIEEVFKGNDHIINKWLKCKEKNPSFGNFEFIFLLDEYNLGKLFNYLHDRFC